MLELVTGFAKPGKILLLPPCWHESPVIVGANGDRDRVIGVPGSIVGHSRFLSATNWHLKKFDFCDEAPRRAQFAVS